MINGAGVPYINKVDACVTSYLVFSTFPIQRDLRHEVFQCELKERISLS